MRKHFKPNLYFFFCRLLSDSKQFDILRKARSCIKQRRFDEAVSVQASGVQIADHGFGCGERQGGPAQELSRPSRKGRLP